MAAWSEIARVKFGWQWPNDSVPIPAACGAFIVTLVFGEHELTRLMIEAHSAPSKLIGLTAAEV